MTVDTQFAAQPACAARRERMLHLVNDVCQREGRTYPVDPAALARRRQLWEQQVAHGTP